MSDWTWIKQLANAVLEDSDTLEQRFITVVERLLDTVFSEDRKALMDSLWVLRRVLSRVVNQNDVSTSSLEYRAGRIEGILEVFALGVLRVASPIQKLQWEIQQEAERVFEEIRKRDALRRCCSCPSQKNAGE